MNEQQTENRPSSPFEAIGATMARMGVRATVRQLAAAAAITWGTRSAINQAAEAQEQVTVATMQLADLEQQRVAAEQRITEVTDRLAELESKLAQPGLVELVTNAVTSGDFDELVIERYTAISAETAPTTEDRRPSTLAGDVEYLNRTYADEPQPEPLDDGSCVTDYENRND